MVRLGETQPTEWDAPVSAINSKPDYNSWFVLVGRNRDSDSVSTVNFKTACTEFGIDADSKQELGNGAAVVRFNHWAVGWYELLIIDPNDEDAVSKAEDIEASLEEYPVLDDEALSAYEWEEMDEAWLDYMAHDFQSEILHHASEEHADKLDDYLDELPRDKLREALEDHGGMIEHGGHEIVLGTHSVKWDQLIRALLNGEYARETDLDIEGVGVDDEV